MVASSMTGLKSRTRKCGLRPETPMVRFRAASERPLSHKPCFRGQTDPISHQNRPALFGTLGFEHQFQENFIAPTTAACITPPTRATRGSLPEKIQTYSTTKTTTRTTHSRRTKAGTWEYYTCCKKSPILCIAPNTTRLSSFNFTHVRAAPDTDLRKYSATPYTCIPPTQNNQSKYMLVSYEWIHNKKEKRARWQER